MAAPLIALLSLNLVQAAQPRASLVIPPTVAQMVMVDAFVTDRKGRPITDLHAEDFELLEDHKRVEITAFDPPSSGPHASAVGRPPAPSSPPTVAALRDQVTLVIYVDRWLLSGRGRRVALDQAYSLAERHLAEGARAVVIADEKGLHPLSPLTADPAAIRAVLTRIQGWATRSPGADDTRGVLDDIKAVLENGPCGCECISEPISLIRGYAFRRMAEVQEAGDRLTFLVNALLGVPGRKALIYVSEGLEERPGIQLYDQLLKICPQAATRDASQIFAAMQEFETSSPLKAVTARANAARVTFYPIDARGLTTLSSADISQPDQRYVPSARNDMVRDANLTALLHLLGEETGGFAMLKGLDPTTAMKRFDADAQGHYLLGFVPGEADGKVHDLTVRLNDKQELKRHPEIRHRRAYLRAELPARRGQRSLATLLFGLEENALGAEVSVERTSEAMARVRVSVPWSALAALPDSVEGARRVQVVISLRSTESSKSPLTVREKDVTLDQASGDPASAGDRREIVVDVPIGEGDYEFAIGVEDVASGSASYLKRRLGEARDE